MGNVSGPYLNKLVEDLSTWAAQERQVYIKALTQGGPYGSQKLSPDEQIQRFVQSKPQDYEAMIVKLNEKYRGLPNAQDLVNKDLANYFRRMVVLLLSRGQLSDQEFNQQQSEIEQDIAPGAGYQIGGGGITNAQ